eukprot:759724-Hanusia_phi.AAC.6
MSDEPEDEVRELALLPNLAHIRLARKNVTFPPRPLPERVRAPGKHVKQDAPKGERVDAHAAFLSSDLLGRPPTPRPRGRLEARVLVLQLLREPHVADLDPPQLRDEQVHRLQVPVHDVHAMQVTEAADELEHGGVWAEELDERVERGGGELLDQRRQGALTELEGEVEEAAVALGIEVPDDVGMHVGGDEKIHLLLRHLHKLQQHPLDRDFSSSHPPPVHNCPLTPVSQHLLRVDLQPPHCHDGGQTLSSSLCSSSSSLL